MSDRFCQTCRFYRPNIGMRGEPYCDRLKKWVGTTLCCSEWQPKKPKTNADRIRQMSDEKLATFLFNNVSCSDCTMHGGGCSIDCEKWMLSWLKSPVEVDNGT